MGEKLSTIAPRVWGEVLHLNKTMAQIWDDLYPVQAIDEFNRDKAKGSKKANVGEQQPIKHYAPVQYPNVIFPPTITEEGLPVQPNDVFSDNYQPSAKREDPGLLLFIGLNPSGVEKNVDLRLHDFENRNISYDEIISREAEVWRDYETYFGPIKRFRTPLWKYHVDMFGLRHTSSKVISELLTTKKYKHIKEEMTQFLLAQINALHSFTCQVQPSQVIIINALSSRILTDKLLPHGFDYKYGSTCPWYEEPARILCHGISSYIHSAGMMSSGNMDNGSLERLQAESFRVYQRRKVKV